jgi:indole-3-glycerol phosphate synthase
MSDILNKILAVKADEVAAAKQSRSLASLRGMVESGQSARAGLRGFEAGLRGKIAAGQAGVIAEVKKASPSKGILRADFDPAQIAASYAEHGAACLSVLTDVQFFQGATAYLEAARAACDLPVIRKDFIVDPYQVYEAAAAGADAILLIVAALHPEDLAVLHREARDLDLDVLVEIHDEEELDVALEVDADLLGINNRDLTDFSVDLQRTYDLLADVPAGKMVVSESGIASREQLEELERVGVDAVLVGTTLMRSPDVEAACAELVGATSERDPHDN